MYKFSKIKGEVKRKIPDISKYLSSVSELTSAYLFGSYAREEDNHISDVDIALLFDNKLSLAQINQLELLIWKKLTVILQTDEVDLLVINKIPLSLQFEIIRSGTIICNNDNNQRTNFEVHTCASYWDFKKLKDEYDMYSIKKLKKKYLEEDVDESK